MCCKGFEGSWIDAYATLTEETDVNPCARLEIVTFKSRSFSQIHCETDDFSVSNAPFDVFQALVYALTA